MCEINNKKFFFFFLFNVPHCIVLHAHLEDMPLIVSVHNYQ